MYKYLLSRSATENDRRAITTYLRTCRSFLETLTRVLTHGSGSDMPPSLQFRGRGRCTRCDGEKLVGRAATTALAAPRESRQVVRTSHDAQHIEPPPRALRDTLAVDKDVPVELDLYVPDGGCWRSDGSVAAAIVATTANVTTVTTLEVLVVTVVLLPLPLRRWWWLAAPTPLVARE